MARQQMGRPPGSTFNVIGGGAGARTSDSARGMRAIGSGTIAGRDATRLDRSSAKCAVCNSPHIVRISEMFLLGHGPKLIMKSLPTEVSEEGHPHHLTVHMLKHHFRSNHMVQANAIATKVILEDRMEQLGLVVEEFEGLVADRVVISRVMMQRYYEALVTNPNWVPAASDVIQVMKLYGEIEAKEATSIDTAAYNQVIGVLIEVIKSVAPEKFDEIMHRVSTNPLVMAIAHDHERKATAAQAGLSA